jgi:hypothetical protein
MSQVHVEVSDVVDARPEEIYAVLSDYHVGHAAILPKPYFADMTVEQGGKGAGTVIRLRMKVFGTERVFRQVVSEPEPGRVLVEMDADAGVVTTFTIEPLGGGKQSRVTIVTDSRVSPGIQGLIEKLINPSFLRRLYKQELRNLAEYVRSQRSSVSAS